MPAAIKLRIVSARDLPVMDSPTDSTDAYVEVCFADAPPLKTRVEKRTLNPTVPMASVRTHRLDEPRPWS